MYTFGHYIDYDERETLARIYTEDEVPLNVSLDAGSDMDLKAEEPCSAAFWSNDYEVSVYPSEEAYYQAAEQAAQMASIAMIPMGTFSPEQQTAAILFSGIVREVERNPEPQEGMPLWRLRIETYAFHFDLYYYQDEPVAPGYVIHGQAWLYGKVTRA